MALETGISVGTLYDYFPNKQALLSGYVRHCMDVLLERFKVPTATGHWRDRVHRLVQLTCGFVGDGMPYFDHDMLLLEAQIAEPKHHRRVYEELVAAWQANLAQCDDLPVQPTANTVRSLVIAAWGGRRYFLLVEPRDIEAAQWAEEMQRLCIAAFESAPA